jgi:hypothetical protein
MGVGVKADMEADMKVDVNVDMDEPSGGLVVPE